MRAEPEQGWLFDLGLVDFRRLRETQERLMTAEKALTTRRTYASQWKAFCEWCLLAGRSHLPATTGSVSDFLLWSLNQGFRIATIDIRLHAITHYHHAEKLPTPVDASVRELLYLARRDRKEGPRGMAAITYAQLAAIVAGYSDTDTIEVRNRSMLLLSFAAGWRRSEVVALNLRDVRMVRQGITLWQSSSKTDQVAEGRLVGIEPGQHACTCPVIALNTWLRLRGDFPGALFPKITRRGRITRDPLHYRGAVLYHLVKRGLKAIGDDPAGYGAHSLRSGMITASVEAGASEASIKQRTGHKCSETLQRYIRPATAFSMNPLAGVL